MPNASHPTSARVDSRRPLHPAAFVGLLGLLSSIGPAAFDIYLPGLPELARDLDSPQWLVQVTVATYFVGLGVGQILAGPVSDIFGRRRPLFISLAAFSAMALACALSPSIEVLATSRFLLGATAAAGMTISRAVIRDLHAGAAGARMLSRIVMVYGLAPVLAPVIGAQVLLVSSWRGTFGLLVGLALLLIAAAAWLLPETLPPEQRRTGFAQTRADLGLLLRNRSFVGYATVVGLSAAALASYISSSPFVIQGVYDASAQVYGALYGLLALGIIVGSQLNAHLLSRHSPDRLLALGVGIGLANGIAMLALAALGAPLPLLCLTFLVLMFTWGFIPTNAVALAMLDHPERAGTASAVVGLFQYMISALAMPLVGFAGEGSAVPMAVAVMSISALSLLVLRTYAEAHRPAAPASAGP